MSLLCWILIYFHLFLGRNRVEDIDDLEDGRQYVATSQRKIKRLDYGNKRNSKRPFIIPRPPSNTKYRPMKDEQFFQKRRHPKLLTIVSCESSENMTRYVLKPRMDNFEMVLQELSNKLRLNSGPVSALVNDVGQRVRIENKNSFHFLCFFCCLN